MFRVQKMLMESKNVVDVFERMLYDCQNKKGNEEKSRRSDMLQRVWKGENRRKRDC